MKLLDVTCSHLPHCSAIVGHFVAVELFASYRVGFLPYSSVFVSWKAGSGDCFSKFHLLILLHCIILREELYTCQTVDAKFWYSSALNFISGITRKCHLLETVQEYKAFGSTCFSSFFVLMKVAFCRDCDRDNQLETEEFILESSEGIHRTYVVM